MHKVKHQFFGHTTREIKQILGAVFAMSIVFFLWQWRTADFTVLSGILFFTFLFFVTLVSMAAKQALHFYWARKMGYRYEYEHALAGNLISVFITLFSYAYVIFLAPGGTLVHHDPTRRVGKYYYGRNQKDVAFIAFVGPLANFIIAFLLGFFYRPETNMLLHTVIFVNLMIAVFSLLPLPKYDGLSIFVYRRILWFFLFALFLLYSILFLVAHVHSIWLTLILAGIITIGFFFLTER